LQSAGQGHGSRVAIIMSMTPFAVALYLAAVYIGAAVVSVAESFSAAEMKTRLEVGGTTLIVVQVCTRGVT
jgi:acetyl-CoA synthetase